MNFINKVFSVLWNHFFALKSTIKYTLNLNSDWESILNKFDRRKNQLDDMNPITILFEDNLIVVKKRIKFNTINSNYVDQHYVVAKIFRSENEVSISSERELGNFNFWIIKIGALLITIIMSALIFYNIINFSLLSILKDLGIIILVNSICIICNYGPKFYTDPMFNYLKEIVSDSQPGR